MQQGKQHICNCYSSFPACPKQWMMWTLGIGYFSFFLSHRPDVVSRPDVAGAAKKIKEKRFEEDKKN